MIEIGGRRVGIGHPPVVSCDLSLNHLGDTEKALRMVDAIAEAGAQACKVQYFRTEDFMAADSGDLITYGFPPTTTGAYGFYKRHEISLETVRAIRGRAKEAGLIFHVTTTSKKGVEELSGLPDTWKVASDMVGKADMIAAMRETGLPLIISTGHMTVEDALAIAEPSDILLHCVSEYPAKSPRLWRLTALRDALEHGQGGLQRDRSQVGYSHHSYHIEAVVRAAELGGVWLEVHFREGDSVDAFALDEKELKALVEAVK